MHTSDSSSRSARGNAALIHLAFETTLEPAYAQHQQFQFLAHSIELMQSLRQHQYTEPTAVALSTDPQSYRNLAALLEEARIQTARLLAENTDQQQMALIQRIQQTISKCESRAERVVRLTTNPERADTPAP